MDAPPPKEARIAQGVADARPFLPELPAEIWRIVCKLGGKWEEGGKLRKLSRRHVASVRLLCRAAAQGAWRAMYGLAFVSAGDSIRTAMWRAHRLSWDRRTRQEMLLTNMVQAQAGILATYYTHIDVLRSLRMAFKRMLRLDDRGACKGFVVAIRALRDDTRTLSRYYAIGSDPKSAYKRHVDGYHSSYPEDVHLFWEDC